MKAFPVLLMVIAAVSQAQAPMVVAPAPLGHLTGSVTCHDSGRPGRFASIQLLSAQAAALPSLEPAAGTTATDRAKSLAAITSALKSVFKGVINGSDLSTLTGLDGRFHLDRVPPGTYYVIAQLQGYRSPLSGLSQTERMAASSETLAAIASESQKIVVSAGQSLDIRIDLDRGATLSGIVAYSDGSPAQNVTPQLLLQEKAGTWKQLGLLGSLPTLTDDRGAFRFSGLSPGHYAVMAALPAQQAIIGVGLAQLSTHLAPGDALVVYSGGAMRESDLKPIELGGGDNRDGIRITFPLEGLHTISGTVIAASDHHPVNSGRIELQDPGTKASLRSAPVGRDGTFQLHYIPEGEYLLKVTRAADMQAGPDDLPCPVRCKEMRSYASTASSVTVKGDLAAILLAVTDMAPRATGATDAP